MRGIKLLLALATVCFIAAALAQDAVATPYGGSEWPVNGSYISKGTPTVHTNITDTVNGVDVSTITLLAQKNVGGWNEISSVKTAITNGYNVSYTQPGGPSIFQDGDFLEFRANANDTLGNPMTEYYWNFTIDTFVPNMTIASPTNATNWTYANNGFSINATCNDSGRVGGYAGPSGAKYAYVNDSHWGTDTSPGLINLSNTSSLSVGATYYITLSCNDSANNTNTSTTYFTYVGSPPALTPVNNTNISTTYQILSCSGYTMTGESTINYILWGSSDGGTTYSLNQNSTATTYNWTGITDQKDYLWKCQANGVTKNVLSENSTARYINHNTVSMTFQAKAESNLALLDNITLIFTNSTTINVSGPSGANYNLNFTADDISAGTDVKVEFGQNASLYRNRTMYFNLPLTANTTYTAYLPANSTAVLATFGVQDKQSVAKTNVIVRANKTIGSAVYTVGEGLTDGTGVTSMYLTSGSAYDIYAIYEGVTYRHGIIYAAETSYIITINSSSVINMSSVLLNDIIICVDPNNVTINTSNTTWYVNFTYNVTSIDPKLSLYGAGLYCNGTTLLGMVNSTTTAYGGLIYVYANVYGCTYVTWQYWLQNSYAGYYGTYLNLTTTTTYGLGLEEAFRLLAALPKAVKDLIAVLILTISAVGLSVFNVEAAAIGTLVIGAMLVYAGVLSWGVYLVTFIGALAVIFIRRRY